MKILKISLRRSGESAEIMNDYKLISILSFILKHHCLSGVCSLPNSRITKLVFLSDWFHVLSYGKQISNIKWYFDNYGPYVKDVLECIEKNPQLFDLKITPNIFGAPKREIGIVSTESIKQYDNALSKEESNSIKTIVDFT